MDTKMSAVMDRMIAESIDAACLKLCKTGADDARRFAHALLVELGLAYGDSDDVLGGVGRRAAAGAASAASAASAADDDDASTDSVSADAAPAEPAADAEPKSDRKRTVSKKMKDEFAAAGGDDKQLKAAMKAYKAASDDQVAVGWAAFAAAFRGAAPPATPAKPKKAQPAKPDAPKKEPRAKAERNFTWTPAAKKLFAETVEASGGTVSDLLKDRFAAHANAMTPEQFKVLAAVGHMRAFLTKPAEPAAAAPAAPAADDDEDMESFEFEGEELFIGLSSGKVYRQSEGAGDVLIGVAGQGRFKDVKVPAAE